MAEQKTRATRQRKSSTPRRTPKRTLSRLFGSGGLNGIAEIRTFFRTNEQPIYFVGPTAFNLLGIDRWVRNFQYIAYYDSWDGAHPRVFTPKNKPYVEFESSEHINNYLLRDAEVRAYLKRRGGTPMVAMVFFDEETEEICRELGYKLILPPDSLRRRLDSKIVTTQLGNEAWRSFGAECARQRRFLYGAAGAGRLDPSSAPTWWSRRPTVIPARRRSSSSREADWDDKRRATWIGQES